MWLKKIFNIESKQACEKQDYQPMEEDEEINQSKIFTVSQEEVDLRYSHLRIINMKSLHLPANQIHFIESVFFEDKEYFEGKIKYDQHFIKLQQTIITDRQIIIIPNILSNSKHSVYKNNILHVYFGMIEKIELQQLKKQTPKLQITLKDDRVFYLQSIMVDKLRQVQKLIKMFGFPNGVNEFYAFKYGKVSKNVNGWNIYNFQNEMKRQSIMKYTFNQNIHIEPQTNQVYQLINNRNFQLSPTYPEYIIVPIGLTYQEIIKCSKFRTKERLPALTYLHEYEPNMFVSLFRCSQNKGGILTTRCEEDEKMIREIDLCTRHISKKSSSSNKVNCKIYDARGYYAALGNKLGGKGFEKTQYYNCQIQFLNIPNIHAVRDCYNKLRCFNPFQTDFTVAIGSSGWIDYLFLILSGAKSMVKSMLNGVNVIVHCSDGWDRTSQLSTLTQLILDPYYRTLEGFAVLIEKEWRQFGHKFRERSGQFNQKDYHSHQKSPIFIQLLDCILQIMRQFPLSFQFNIQLLNCLATEYQSYTYGTFLTNNIKQGRQINLQKLTISVWSDIFQNKNKYINSFYKKNGPKVLDISVDTKDFVVWKQFLIEQVSAKEQQWTILKRQLEININLRDNIKNYDKQIEQLNIKLAKKK